MRRNWRSWRNPRNVGRATSRFSMKKSGSSEFLCCAVLTTGVNGFIKPEGDICIP